MERRITVGVCLLVVLFLAGLILPFIGKNRDLQKRLYCQNNLRMLGLATSEAGFEVPGEKRESLKKVPAIPAGTLVESADEVENRWSFLVSTLQHFDQRYTEAADARVRANLKRGWSLPENELAVQVKLRPLVCYSNPIVSQNGPALTQYVGIGGLGKEAPTLGLNPAACSKAGAFRYDSVTPLTAFQDGTSHTFLFGEISTHVGPWAQGGPSTIRCLEEGTPLFGKDGQFGGNHPRGSYFAYADGSVHFIAEGVDDRCLRVQSTLCGGENEFLLDD